MEQIVRLCAEVDEARAWARHGYEIGQRHCGWTDHGVAPAWLTDGWPPHIDDCQHSAALGQAEAQRSEAAQLSHQYRSAAERAEARIAAALAVVDRFDEYLFRRDAVADLRDALNGTGNSQSATTSSQISSKHGCPDPIECDHEAALGQAEARVAAVRALHGRDDSNPLGPWCDICLCKWPCRTTVALGELSGGAS